MAISLDWPSSTQEECYLSRIKPSSASFIACHSIPHCEAVVQPSAVNKRPCINWISKLLPLPLLHHWLDGPLLAQALQAPQFSVQRVPVSQLLRKLECLALHHISSQLHSDHNAQWNGTFQSPNSWDFYRLSAMSAMQGKVQNNDHWAPTLSICQIRPSSLRKRRSQMSWHCGLLPHAFEACDHPVLPDAPHKENTVSHKVYLLPHTVWRGVLIWWGH